MEMERAEQQLGRYRVQFAQFGRRGWQCHGPWMCLFITDQRLMMVPDEEPADQAPMVITPRKIQRVWRAALGKRDGGIIQLRSGELLYFYVEWSQGAQLVKNLKQMLGARVLPATGSSAHRKQIIN